jgi:hypothetical protein
MRLRPSPRGIQGWDRDVEAGPAAESESELSGAGLGLRRRLGWRRLKWSGPSGASAHTRCILWIQMAVVEVSATTLLSGNPCTWVAGVNITCMHMTCKQVRSVNIDVHIPM